MDSVLDYCFKFYKTFTALEVEILYCLHTADYHNVIGGYVALSEALGRGTGNLSTMPNIRKAAISLWEKGYINLFDSKAHNIPNDVDKPKNVVGFSLVENFNYKLSKEIVNTFDDFRRKGVNKENNYKNTKKTNEGA